MALMTMFGQQGADSLLEELESLTFARWRLCGERNRCDPRDAQIDECFGHRQLRLTVECKAPIVSGWPTGRKLFSLNRLFPAFQSGAYTVSQRIRWAARLRRRERRWKNKNAAFAGRTGC